MNELHYFSIICDNNLITYLTIKCFFLIIIMRHVHATSFLTVATNRSAFDVALLA